MNSWNIGIRTCAAVAVAVMAMVTLASEPNTAAPGPAAAAPAVVAPVSDAAKPLIQIALLLDTSSSMNGLINQAKTQLWSIVNDMVTARREGQMPEFQVALYEYGNSRLPSETGWIRQVLSLTSDLDAVSRELFALTTSGGSEHCGQVIQEATQKLAWSASGGDYKAIFIAGNEPFTQGPVKYQDACRAAIARGIVVNTIHCGPEQQGIDGKWKDGALLADGSYLTIDQNRAIVHIEAPQDAELARLGTELNGTYVAYGVAGAAGLAEQRAQDGNSMSVGTSNMAQRAFTKANANYRNENWDLVDAHGQGKVKIAEVKVDELPEAMREMTPQQRVEYVEQQSQRRAVIQQKINELNKQRQEHVAAEMKKVAGDDKTLDRALLQTVREQAAKKDYKFSE